MSMEGYMEPTTPLAQEGIGVEHLHVGQEIEASSCWSELGTMFFLRHCSQKTWKQLNILGWVLGSEQALHIGWVFSVIVCIQIKVLVNRNGVSFVKRLISIACCLGSTSACVYLA